MTRPISPRTRTRPNSPSITRFTAPEISETVNSGAFWPGAGVLEQLHAPLACGRRAGTIERAASAGQARERAHEHPDPRRRRARACAGLGLRAEPEVRPALVRAGQRRHRRGGDLRGARHPRRRQGAGLLPRERHRLRDGRPGGAAGRGRRRRAARRRRPDASGRAGRRRGSRRPRPSPRRSAPPAARRPPPARPSPTRRRRAPTSRPRARRSWSRPTGSPPARG